MKTGYKYTRKCTNYAGFKVSGGGAKHLRELETHGGNVDITRVTRYADKRHTNPKHLNGSN